MVVEFLKSFSRHPYLHLQTKTDFHLTSLTNNVFLWRPTLPHPSSLIPSLGPVMSACPLKALSSQLPPISSPSHSSSSSPRSALHRIYCVCLSTGLSGFFPSRNRSFLRNSFETHCDFKMINVWSICFLDLRNSHN